MSSSQPLQPLQRLQPAPSPLPVALARASAALLLALPLSACDQLGIESATALAARKEAEGKAIGAGCRHAARSVEQCYVTNKRADKAAVFAGWKEMNDYMRENKIEAVPPPPPPPPPADGAAPGEEGGEADKAGKGGKAAAGKH
jgi:hypothetical protein